MIFLTWFVTGGANLTKKSRFYYQKKVKTNKIMFKTFKNE